MEIQHNHVLLLEPEELVFTNVRLKQVYSKCVRITNPMDTRVKFRIKPGSPSRYRVMPEEVEIAPKKSVLVAIQLKLERSIAGKGSKGHKDVFRITSDLFKQHFFAIFYAWGINPSPRSISQPKNRQFPPPPPKNYLSTEKQTSSPPPNPLSLLEHSQGEGDTHERGGGGDGDDSGGVYKEVIDDLTNFRDTTRNPDAKGPSMHAHDIATKQDKGLSSLTSRPIRNPSRPDQDVTIPITTKDSKAKSGALGRGENEDERKGGGTGRGGGRVGVDEEGDLRSYLPSEGDDERELNRAR
ncbi:hypothetical protein AAMO2058_000339900, partial [Amorphochlora amoebiformis]